MPLKDLWMKYRDTIIFLLISIVITWAITWFYSKKSFEEWQIKVAKATASNIRLEQNMCDLALQTINSKNNILKNKDSQNIESTLEMFDNVKNQIVILKEVVKNSKELFTTNQTALLSNNLYSSANFLPISTDNTQIQLDKILPNSSDSISVNQSSVLKNLVRLRANITKF